MLLVEHYRKDQLEHQHQLLSLAVFVPLDNDPEVMPPAEHCQKGYLEH